MTNTEIQTVKTTAIFWHIPLTNIHGIVELGLQESSKHFVERDPENSCWWLFGGHICLTVDHATKPHGWTWDIGTSCLQITK